MSSGCHKYPFFPAVVVIMALLAGCSVVPESVIPESPPPSTPPSSGLVVTGQMDDMMQYYESLRRLPPAELGRVHDKVKQNFGKNKSDANRMRLVLLLTLPNTSFRDINAALQLLNDWPRNTRETTNLQSFRNLMAGLLSDQQRLTQSVDELTQKLKEEQKRITMLQSQIEAIKSMEKTLIFREP